MSIFMWGKHSRLLPEAAGIWKEQTPPRFVSRLIVSRAGENNPLLFECALHWTAKGTVTHISLKAGRRSAQYFQL